MKQCITIRAIGLNLVFLLLYIFLGSCITASLDDFFMSSVLTGAYGAEYDVHLYFVNATYGFFLKPFYWLCPRIGWYYIFEVLEVFASFSVFTYFLLKKVDKLKGLLLSLLLLASFSPVFYFQLDFTKNAALLTASGILLIFFGEKNKKVFIVAGVLMLVAGFVMRKEAFLLGMPYIGILLLIGYFKEKRLSKEPVIGILISFVIIAILFFFNRSLYQNNEYQYYAEYQNPRAVFVDGNYYDSDATLDEIVELGKHGLDYSMLKDWTFYDTEIFSRDSLQQYLNIIERNKYDISWTKMPFAIFGEIALSFQEQNVWCWAFFAFLLTLFAKKCGFIVWSSLLVVIISFIYLLEQNRNIIYVEHAIWMYATVFLIPFLQEDSLNSIKISISNSFILFSFAIALFGLGFWNTPNYLKNSLFKEKSKNDALWEDFFAYEVQQQNEVFFMEYHPYKSFARRLSGSYKALAKGRLNKIFPLGYWNVYLPGMIAALKENGIKNPMQSLTNSNVRVIQYNDVDLYQKYYRLHLNRNIEYETIPFTSQSGFDMMNYNMIRYYGIKDEIEKN